MSRADGAQNPAPPARAGRGELFSWMLFDFANSSYTTLIVTVVFSPYFIRVVVPAAGHEETHGDWLWGLSTLISQLLVVLSAPLIGAIADHSGVKKRFLTLSWIGCVIGTAALGLVGPGSVLLGMVIFIVSNVLFSSGENLIAAFLPEITTPEKMGKISGLGWGIGYAGGLLSLAACFPFIREGFSAANSVSLRFSFVVVALFFLVGGLPTYLFLRERTRPLPLPPGENYASVGFRRVFQTLGHIRRYRQLFRFLPVFLCYNSGVTIVISFASVYALDQIGLDEKQLMIFFMIVQISAALGALAFGFLQDRTGARTAIILSLLIWLVVCLGAYSTTDVKVFYIIGNLAGIAMGACQSGGRALVGTFSPKSRSGEFFGFWGLFWKLSSGIGPFVFGTVSALLGSRRDAILATALFFVLGILGMFFIDEREGRRAAEEAEDPAVGSGGEASPGEK